MIKPILSFVCWNRAGLTARNLNALLKTTDDFELHIIDSNSQDNTWDFIEKLKDPRIVEIKKLDLNRGPAYAINYVMSQRKKGQFFTHIDSDTFIITPNWITLFMKVMETYPELGAACTVSQGILDRWKKRYTFKYVERNGVGIEESGLLLAGNCICIRPECLDKLGYLNEEMGRCDVDYAQRILIGTNYKMAFVPDIKINQVQKITCDECQMSELCSMKNESCFKIRDSKYQNVIFTQLYAAEYNEYIADLRAGRRPIYCASIHDEESIKRNYYDKESAERNFKHYIDNAN